MSESNDHDLSAREYLSEGADHVAIVHALLAIKAELRTANLLAAIASKVVTSDVDWGTVERMQFPEVDAIRDEIREELDLDDRETR